MYQNTKNNFTATHVLVCAVCILSLLVSPYTLEARETRDHSERNAPTQTDPTDPETVPQEEAPADENDNSEDTSADTSENTTPGSNQQSDTNTATIKLRNANDLIFSESYTFEEGGTTYIESSDGAHMIEVDSTSALAAITKLDHNSEIFTITDLQYYPSFGSFFLNCIEVSGEELCGSWQYTVNNSYPSIGLDQYTLTNGDSLFLFFGSPRIVESPGKVTVGEAFVATAHEFNAETGLYEPVTGYTIGVIQDNPDNPWSPTEIITKSVDQNGEAEFTLSETGTYKLGLQEDYYYPTVTFTVVDKANTSGGGSYSSTFDIDTAVAFLAREQQSNGSFGAPLYSDWAAIALSTVNNEARNRVRDFLIKNDSASSHVTDHERRAIALMALGISPYNGTHINHIEAILNAFDGSQIGNKNQINDDIFGLIVLRAAGFNHNDREIAAIRDEVIRAQKTDGSWEGTVDMTAAAVQSLAGLSGVSTSLANARNFLKSKQDTDGGFGNSFSTSWAIQAIIALNEDPDNWKTGSNSPLEYLAKVQENDGGVEQPSATLENRIWATSYAVLAAQKMTWLSSMKNFTKSDTIAQNSSTVLRNQGEPENALSTSIYTDFLTLEKPAASGREKQAAASVSQTAVLNKTLSPSSNTRTNSRFAFVSDQTNTPESQATSQSSDDGTSDSGDSKATTPSVDEHESNSEVPVIPMVMFGLLILTAGVFVFRK